MRIKRLELVASDPFTSLSWRPSSWSLRPQKVRLEVVDKVPVFPCATAPEARITAPNVAMRRCALMPGLIFSYLTSLGRAVAGQSGNSLHVHDHRGARDRGGVLGARACGSVVVAGQPDVCAYGPNVKTCRPCVSARPLHQCAHH